MYRKGGNSIKLVIIRHPETNEIANLPGERNAPSPEGLKKLAHLTDVCHKEHVEAVAYSTLPRSAISAELLTKDLGVPGVPLDSLQERYFGKWDREDWPRISVELSKLSIEDRYTFKPPGNGESWEEMDARLLTALNEIAKLERQSVAVMTHAGSMRVLLVLLGSKSKVASTKFIPALGQSVVVEYEP
jgi:broad specificity phosphatase PhoE